MADVKGQAVFKILGFENSKNNLARNYGVGLKRLGSQA